MEYYSAIKIIKEVSYVLIWKDLQSILRRKSCNAMCMVYYHLLNNKEKSAYIWKYTQKINNNCLQDRNWVLGHNNGREINYCLYFNNFESGAHRLAIQDTK